jgi:hypothetical protein
MPMAPSALPVTPASATRDARLGAVSFLHRFGSALNPHFHFHVVVLDGVFSEGDDGSVTFHEAPHLSADDVLRLERALQRRVLRLFQRRRLLDEDTVEDMLTWQASGGFGLDASVRIHASDADGRERLLRYHDLVETRSRRTAHDRAGEKCASRDPQHGLVPGEDVRLEVQAGRSAHQTSGPLCFATH